MDEALVRCESRSLLAWNGAKLGWVEPKMDGSLAQQQKHQSDQSPKTDSSEANINKSMAYGILWLRYALLLCCIAFDPCPRYAQMIKTAEDWSFNVRYPATGVSAGLLCTVIHLWKCLRYHAWAPHCRSPPRRSTRLVRPTEMEWGCSGFGTL